MAALLAAAPEPVRVGVVGGGLMGRELAGLLGRWPSLVDHPVRPVLAAVADPAPAARAWFERLGVPTHERWDALLDDPDIDVVYLAVPHDLHEEVYVAAARAGKDLLGEKPFGIDLPAARRIAAAIDEAGVFARASSEMPFFPGAQRAFAHVASGGLGEVVEVRSGFSHSSDLDRTKPSNWKRRAATCGELGVMGDLGLHVAHLPLRLGWRPSQVYAQLDDVVTSRPSPEGDVPCDTWDNALLATRVPHTAARAFPMLWEARRIAPGQMNTWWFEALGMDGGVRFSTRSPAVLDRFKVRRTPAGGVAEQVWEQVQPGSVSAWPTSAGPIFEFGFADALLQMWAAFLAERAGALGDRFGCATPAEAVTAHEVFDAALRSHASGAAVPVGSGRLD